MAKKALPKGIVQRPNGTLQKNFTVNGKRYSVYGKTKKELDEKEREKRNQLDKASFTDNKKITLNTYFEEWIKFKSLSVKANSIRLYKDLYTKHISNSIGCKKIANIHAQDIINLQIELSKKLSTSSCNTTFTVLNMVFKDAINAQIITNNPTNALKALKRTEESANKTIHRALTLDEQKAFMDEIRSNYYYNVFAFLLCTGVRFGEASALTWGDIDFKNNDIVINKTISADVNGRQIVNNTAKSKSGNRTIKMNAQIKHILKSQRAIYGNIIPSSDDLVFQGLYGRVIRNCTINSVIKKTLKQLDEKGIHIEPFSVHAFRDTFATRFIENGGNPQTLKSLLGHSSINITMDLYAHVLPNTKQEEMDKLHIAI